MENATRTHRERIENESRTHRERTKELLNDTSPNPNRTQQLEKTNNFMKGMFKHSSVLNKVYKNIEKLKEEGRFTETLKSDKNFLEESLKSGNYDIALRVGESLLEKTNNLMKDVPSNIRDVLNKLYENIEKLKEEGRFTETLKYLRSDLEESLKSGDNDTALRRGEYLLKKTNNLMKKKGGKKTRRRKSRRRKSRRRKSRRRKSRRRKSRRRKSRR